MPEDRHATQLDAESVSDAESDAVLRQAMAAYLRAIDAGHPPDRDAFLAEHLDVADGLRAFFEAHDAVERLAEPLHAIARAAQLGTPLGPEADAPEPGARVRYFGDYELIEELARGGMGVVYRARQVTLNRPVALKMLLNGVLAGDDERRRFRVEAEAAANLDHPHIVPIHEVGEHDGHLYFSMKLVEGGSLATHLPTFADDPRAAARLVSTIARAVHHAHQRGVLHRDLKPSNILLDPDGQPHVVDFGLARRVASDTEPTRTGALLGTPAYMAPEQATGRRTASTTATDIHGLGAILYTLLTGKPPFAGDSVLDTLEQVKARTPEPPTALNRRVDRDLQTICLKCLEKEPSRRYTSAEALADDLDRWLRGEPIAARPIGRLERAWRWVRRNPVVAGLTATVGVMLLGSVAGSVGALVVIARQRDTANTMRRQAEENLGLARQAVDDMYTQVALKWLATQPQIQPLQREFLEKALTFYGIFAEQKSSDPDIRRETALAYRRVGQIQSELMRHSEAEAAFRQAIAIHESLASALPARADVRFELAQDHQILGQFLFNTLRYPEADQEYRRAGEVFAALSGANPTDTGAIIDLAILGSNRGQLLAHIGHFDEAEAAYRRVIDQLEGLVPEQPGRHAIRRQLANTYSQLGTMYAIAGHPAEAEAAFRRTIDEMKRLVTDDRDNPDDRSVLGGALHNLGQMQFGHRGDSAEACKLLREAIEHEQAALATNPRHAVAREYLRNHLRLLAAALTQRGQHDEASRAAEEVARMAPGDSMNATIAAELLAGCASSASQDPQLSESERRAAADGYLQRARDSLKAAAGLSKDHPVFQNGLAWYLATCWNPVLRDPDLALELAKNAVRMEPENNIFLCTLGVAHYRAGHWDDTIRVIEKAIQIDVNASSGERFFLAMARWHRGDKEQAIRDYREGLRFLEQAQLTVDVREEMRRFSAEAAALLGVGEPPKPNDRAELPPRED